jgi:hypothetical protein
MNFMCRMYIRVHAMYVVSDEGQARAYIHTYVHPYVFVYSFWQVHAILYVYIYIYIYIYICMYIYIYIHTQCINTPTHTHTHTHTHMSRGDLLVDYVVDMPRTLSAQQRDSLRQILTGM